MVEFEAAFEEPLLGRGFKYFVRGAYNMIDKQYTKTIRPVDPADRETYLGIIEDTAANAIKNLLQKMASYSAEKEGKIQGEPV